jgi:predicted ATP-binding protein involved in virulence
MFLKEVELTNFKCHKHLYLSFAENADNKPIRKTTFLLGENGTGKSALLKAIALITAGSGSLSDMLGTPDDWIKNGEDFCEIAATLTTADGEDREIKLRIDRGAGLKQIIDLNSETLDRIDRAIEHADRNYFVLGYGASRRLNRDPNLTNTRDYSSVRSFSIQSLFNPDATLVSLVSWAIDLDYTGKSEGLDTVRKALNAFLFEDVNFSHIDKEKKQLVFSTPDGDIPLNQLSDGYQNVAAWVGDLMYRINETFRDFKDPLSARGLLLIDEIDLHLHPKWQRQLHNFLTKRMPKFQVIATTHSPLTAQQANEFELYNLRREDGKIEVIPFAGAPNKMLLHQILMSPVFGLETDESVKVEDAKTEVREIEMKKKKSAADKKVLKKHSELLEEVPINDQSNSLFSQEDFELLKTINDELKSIKANS